MVTFVGKTVLGNAAAATTIVITPSPALTNGNTAVVHVTCVDNATTCTLKDNNNVTYTAIDTVDDTGNGVILFSFRSPTGGVAGSPTTLTATFNASAGARGIEVQEWSGVDVSASPLDGHNMAAKAASTTPTSNSITTTVGGDLIVGALVIDGGVTTINAAGSGYTLRNNDATSQLGDESQVQGAAAAITASFAIGASQATIVSIIAFKAAAAGVVDTPKPFIPGKFPVQWNRNLSLLRSRAVDESSFGVETNPHWRGRTWAPQWSPRRALMQNSDPNAPFAQPETNTFFTPRTWPIQWKLWPQGRTTAQDFSSFGVETNPHWAGRAWPVVWTPLTLLRAVPTDVPFIPPDVPVYFQARTWPIIWLPLAALVRLPALDVPLVQSDTPTYFPLRTWPIVWNISIALRQVTAQDFSSSSPETNVQFTPRTWPFVWNLQGSLMRGAPQDFTTLPPATQPVYARYGASHGIGALSAIPGEIPS